jgi:hypothetical protein
LCNEGGDMGCDLSFLVSLEVKEKQRKMSITRISDPFFWTV